MNAKRYQQGLLVVLICISSTACNLLGLIKYAETLGLARVHKEHESPILEHPGQVPLDSAVAAEFAYTTDIRILSLDSVSNHSSFSRWRARFAARDRAHALIHPDGSYEIKVDLYVSKIPGKKPAPLVVQLPPLGNQVEIQDLMQVQFAKRGWHSIAVYPDFDAVDFDQEPKNTQNYMIRNTIAVQQVLDWILGLNLEFIPPVDSTKVFSLGISLGALRNVYLLAADQRICNGAIVMGGADFASIITRSRESSVVKYRQHWSQELGLVDDVEIEAYLRRFIQIDPLSLAQNIAPQRVTQIISLNDTVVHTSRQVQLWEALRQPTMATLDWPYYHSDLFRFPDSWATGHFDIALAQQGVLNFLIGEFQRFTIEAAAENASKLQRLGTN